MPNRYTPEQIETALIAVRDRSRTASTCQPELKVVLDTQGGNFMVKEHLTGYPGADTRSYYLGLLYGITLGFSAYEELETNRKTFELSD